MDEEEKDVLEDLVSSREAFIKQSCSLLHGFIKRATSGQSCYQETSYNAEWESVQQFLEENDVYLVKKGKKSRFYPVASEEERKQAVKIEINSLKIVYGSNLIQGIIEFLKETIEMDRT